MKKALPLLGIMLLQTLYSFAQSLPCGNDRFVSRVFSTSTITPGILYGRNTTYMGVVQDLLMDIYQPTGDAAAIRPLFIYAFGGAFVNGNRLQLASLCDSMARKGYVAVAIDYRLYDNPQGIFGLLLNQNDGIDAVAKGMSDIKAAIRYFKRDAATTKTYRIDTANIFVGGISSGSMAALHTAYINTITEAVPPVSTIINNNGGMEGNTDLPGSPLIGTYSFQGIRGAWNMSGALYDSAYIKAGDPVLFSVHGTADNVVPYGYGRLFSGAPILGAFVCGSSTLNNQAANVGVQSRLLTVAGGDHENMYYLPSTVTLIDTGGPRYFGNIICPVPLPVSGASLKALIAGKNIQLSWQTLTEIDNKSFIVEKQTAGGWKKIAELISKANNGNSVLPINYTFTDVQPEQGSNTYRLQIISLQGSVTYSNTIQVQWLGKSASPFVIYPNPVGSVLYYKTNLATTGKNAIKIYSSDMRFIQTANLNGSNQIPMAGLQKGFYLALVFSDNTQVSSIWFVKD